MRTILIIAHPGHELRVFHWLEKVHPAVCILTDGSGGDKVSRLAYSAAAIAAAGAACGPVFGPMPDQAWYAAILAGDVSPFEQAVAAIANVAAGEAEATIVADAVDGYNPVHDLTSAVGAAVAARLERGGAKVRRLASAAVPSVAGRPVEEVLLDAAAAARKLAAVQAYLPLAEEAQRVLAEDPGSMAGETLIEETFDWPADFEPYWETFGRKRVEAGRYPASISYREHVRPIALRLLSRA